MYFVFAANIPDSKTTGMGRQMHGLGDALVSRGHQVDYLFADNLPNRLGQKMGRLEFPFRLAAELIRKVRVFPGRSIALLHEPVGWVSSLFARNRVRTISMVHNCESKCWQIKLDTRTEIGETVSLKSRVLWPLTELTQSYLSLKSADTVVCLSTEDVNYLTKKLHLDASRVHRIDNGLEPHFMNLPLPVAPTRDLLFLGHWLPHKGISILAKALARLSQLGIEGDITLAGTGSTESKILASLPPAWRPRTEVIPYVPPQQLVQVFQRHRIFVLPSAWEGIPLSMLEAMACGLCPVVSSVGGVPDVVADGKVGYLVPSLAVEALATALARALQHPEETRQVAAAAQVAAQKYSWVHVAKQLEAVCGLTV